MPLELLIRLSLLNVALFILLVKWSVVEWYQLHKPKWLPVCTFCFFFWLAVVEMAVPALMQPLNLLVGIDAVIDSLCAAVLAYYVYATITNK